MDRKNDRKKLLVKQCVAWGVGAVLLLGSILVMGSLWFGKLKGGDAGSKTKEETTTELTTTGTTTEAVTTEEKTTEAVTTEATTEATTEQRYEVEGWEDMPGEILIRVNATAGVVTIYKDNEPVKSVRCSAGYDTPDGTFTTGERYRWLYLMGDVYGQYCTTITGNILFHSVPYHYEDNNSLCVEEYNRLGEYCSHGCVRLQAAYAKWIYDHAEEGLNVEIYEDEENPGPFGMPELELLDEDHTWDPTDAEAEAAYGGTPTDAE